MTERKGGNSIIILHEVNHFVGDCSLFYYQYIIVKTKIQDYWPISVSSFLF
nr:MAG TPA: Matrixin [Caudoviricetes sp.]